jgi:hypothetical protein
MNASRSADKLPKLLVWKRVRLMRVISDWHGARSLNSTGIHSDVRTDITIIGLPFFLHL